MKKQSNHFLCKQAKLCKTSKGKYCVSFSIQARNNGSFHLRKVGARGGGGGVHRKTDTERGRISHFTLASYCSHSSLCLPQYSWSKQKGRWSWADLQMLTCHLRHWWKQKTRRCGTKKPNTGKWRVWQKPKCNGNREYMIYTVLQTIFSIVRHHALLVLLIA